MISFEKGMYLRTIDGKIAKFIKYDEEDEEQLITDYYQYSTIWVGEIASYSFNIVDLIEVGDYVNGNEVLAISEFKDGSRYIEFDEGRYLCKNYQIKSIVTKEQFESMKYSLEG